MSSLKLTFTFRVHSDIKFLHQILLLLLVLLLQTETQAFTTTTELVTLSVTPTYSHSVHISQAFGTNKNISVLSLCPSVPPSNIMQLLNLSVLLLLLPDSIGLLVQSFRCEVFLVIGISLGLPFL